MHRASTRTPVSWARLLLTGALVVGLTQSAACSVRSARSARASGPATRSESPVAPGSRVARLHEADGGPRYYAKFSPSLPTSPSFFPVGVWLAAVNGQSDITSDQAAGLNTYVTLTSNSDFSLVRQSGMYLIASRTSGEGSTPVGWFVDDEADMWAGAGNAKWTGKRSYHGTSCQPATAGCGYTLQQEVLRTLPHDHRFRFANYGKGVSFWETDAQAEQFIDDYQNIVSSDDYWFTDDNICTASEGGKWYDPRLLVNGRLPANLCHLAANYGKTVSRIRYLARNKKPVWAFVELGHPYPQNNWPSIQPQQVIAAVWHSLIAGARGIIYFNHSFGGPCVTDNVLRDQCYARIRAVVTEADREIGLLAPVLNAPFADGVVTASSGVDFSIKWYHHHFYILTGSDNPNAQNVTFSMPCIGSAAVTVLNEHRTIEAPNGTFADHFDNGDTIHIYRIDGGSSCGA
jgi:hypothetical protein